MPDEWNHNLSNENPENMSKKKTGRGSSKCIYVDMLTSDGKKIKIHIPEHIGRAVGKHARNIINFCGMVVRIDAKLSCKNWPTVKKEVGEIMLAKVKDKFEMDVADDQLFSSFVYCTMRRLYRCWKCRLHKAWLNLDENKKENYVPKDVDASDWGGITKYWMSDEFKVIHVEARTQKIGTDRTKLNGQSRGQCRFL
ncbi:uncharacterized protein [Euphorbia lathyris]|uniref:uncharacterized protein n=1 Tax=Euphorbia lathyris TaxID=212925 RepID=UPI003313B0EF